MKFMRLLLLVILLTSCASQPPIPAPIIEQKVVHVTKWSAAELFEIARIKRQNDFQTQFNDATKTATQQGSVALPKLKPHFVRQQNYQEMQEKVVTLVSELVEALRKSDVKLPLSMIKISGFVRNNKHNKRAKKILEQYLNSEIHRQWNASKDKSKGMKPIQAKLQTEKDLILLKLTNKNGRPLAAITLPDFFFYRYVDGIRMDYK